MDAEIIINVQADQPFLDPDIITDLATAMRKDPDIEIASLMSADICENEVNHIVKVNVDEGGYARSFVRSPDAQEIYHHHIGVYGFRASVVQSLSELRPSKNELDLSLEQLRWMDAGYKIRMVAVDHHPHSIDVPEQIKTSRLS